MVGAIPENNILPEDLKKLLEQLQEQERYVLSQIQRAFAYSEKDKEDLKYVIETIKKIEARMKALGDAKAGEFRNEDLAKTVKGTNTKLNRAQKFVDSLHDSDVDPKDLEVVYNNFSQLSELHGKITSRYDEYLTLATDVIKEKNARRNENIKKELTGKESEILGLTETFNSLYKVITTYKPTRAAFIELKKKEVNVAKTTVEEAVENTDIEEHKLANSRENIDRVKVISNFKTNLQASKTAEYIEVPFFASLEHLYDDTHQRIRADKYQEFITGLTGVNVSEINLSEYNPAEIDKLEDLLETKYLGSLDEKEVTHLDREIDEDPKVNIRLSGKVKENVTQRNESKSGIAASLASTKVNLAIATDPYLSRGNDLIRAKQVETAFNKIESGQFKAGIIDLTRLQSTDQFRQDIPGVVKIALKEEVVRAYEGIGSKFSEKLEESRIGRGIKMKRNQISTFVTNKSTFLKEQKRKSKKSDGIMGLVFKFLVKKIVDSSVNFIKSGIKVLKTTSLASRMGNFFSTNTVGQKMQSAATSTLKLAKNVVKLPGEMKNGLFAQYDKVYKIVDNKFVPVIKPAYHAALDVGHVGKTLLKKAPIGAVYGGGAMFLASALGVPTSMLMPIFAGATIAGAGLETIDSLMHTPLPRTPIRPIAWLQKQGSAIYKDPTTKVFSNDIVKNNPEAAAKLAKAGGNAYGSTGARLFSSAKTGLMTALVAGALAGFLGINPIVATAGTFGLVTSAKYILRTNRGQAIAGRLLSGKYGSYLSRLSGLPFNRLVFQIGNTRVMANLIQDLYDNFTNVHRGSPGLALKDFFKDNFVFKSGGSLLETILLKFTTLNNYLSMMGYVSGMSALNRSLLGLMSKVFVGRGLAALFPSAATANLTFLPKVLLAIRGAALTGIFSAIGSVAGLAILAALGVPITGIGAAIGATVGSVVGFGVGVLIAGSATVASLGAGAPLSAIIVTASSAAFTALGGWIGSLFDKVAGATINSVMAIVGGINALFSLIDLALNGISTRKIASMSISLALALPALTALLDYSSQGQVESNSTIPTPTVVVSYNKYPDIRVINNSGFELNNDEVEDLLTGFHHITKDSNYKNKYLVLTNRDDSEVKIEDDLLIVSISVSELEPIARVEELISSIDIKSPEKISLN